MITNEHAKPLLVVENLHAYLQTGYGLVRAVDGVSFSLKQGRSMGLVGESGCGKSMLGRALMRLLPPDSIVSKDTILRFQGQDINDLSGKQIRRIRGRDMAMIFQDPLTSLNPVIKVGQQIVEVLTHHLKIDKKSARDRAIELMQSVGIPMPRRRFEHYPHQLSGGLRQRVAIAIALACKPQLLIADEPTTALDVTIQADILNLLAKLQEENQMAMILITHDLGVVAGRTHETAVMYAGKIVEHAPTSELFSQMSMPYTRALMEAIPHLADPLHTTLQAIDGQPPDLIDPPRGCRFHPRCHQAKYRCKNEEPPLKNINNIDHRSACWYPLKKNEKRV